MNMLGLKGKFIIQLLDCDRTILQRIEVPNGIVNIGLDTILDVMFNGTAPATTWYAGLIDSASYSGISAGDTMASHTGWLEYQNYVEATRPQWNPDNADAQVIINPESAYIEFTIIGNPTLKGLFITSDNAKGGTAGVLWSTALFENSNIRADWEVSDGQVLKIQYQVTAEAG